MEFRSILRCGSTRRRARRHGRRNNTFSDSSGCPRTMDGMIKTAYVSLGLIALAAPIIAETKVKMADLPPAVQAAVKEQTKNATLVGLSKEKEKGKTMYEVETKVAGKTRDLLLDSTGVVVEVEEQIEMSAVPA